MAPNPDALSALRDLLSSIANCLRNLQEENPDLSECLEFIHSVNFDSELNAPLAVIPEHEKLLHQAIGHITNPQLEPIRSALLAAVSHLHWKVDKGGYYDSHANVGEGYKNGNMHTLLIGPENSLVQSDNFLLGLFFLGPRTLYRDHKHLAPELYLPLTGPSGWRFELGEWQVVNAGCVICNSPDYIHATRTYKTPFLALFCWPRDINCRCSVVFSEDWEIIENKLRSS